MTSNSAHSSIVNGCDPSVKAGSSGTSIHVEPLKWNADPTLPATYVTGPCAVPSCPPVRSSGVPSADHQLTMPGGETAHGPRTWQELSQLSVSTWLPSSQAS